MKYILLVLSFALLTVSASAQTTPANAPVTCQLTENRSPAIRGLRLGMALNDLLRLFPGAEEDEYVKRVLGDRAKYPNLGITEFYLVPQSYPTRNQFGGISVIRFITVDDRVAEYSVDYGLPPDGPAWPRIEEWVTRFAETYDLPPLANWTMNQNALERLLVCNGFRISASNLNQRGNVKVATLDLPYQARDQRRRAFDEKLRREFKP